MGTSRGPARLTRGGGGQEVARVCLIRTARVVVADVVGAKAAKEEEQRPAHVVTEGARVVQFLEGLDALPLQEDEDARL